MSNDNTKNPLQGYFKSYVSNFQLGRLKSYTLSHLDYLQSLFLGEKISLFAADATPLYYTCPIYSFDIL